ncbi:cupin domain-containing protein [Granulicella sp. dw_53]|uniref:(R)-mandelonitrile lyase n=1 Tax=Granulicella sp. dw_53 TaxID=2719792 RepID=UPI001BD4D842|nr:cupin domain-containing protein [Granulicella sp. dw_53]
MKILKPEDRPTRPGNPEYFTGSVWLDEVIVNQPPSRLKAFRVSFTPGARTAWHTHPVGQTLHVLAGTGLIQLQGQPVQIIRPGDTVSILPNELHWHGASPNHTMTHLALQEADEAGTDAVWSQQVTDEEYLATPA